MPNICRDCTHYLKPKSGRPRCTREANSQDVDLVSGDQKWPLNLLECEDERYGNGECGQVGRYWQVAEKSRKLDQRQ